MPSTNRNDLMPTYEKLEWVTPKISLMGAADTEKKGMRDCEASNTPCTEFGPRCTAGAVAFGPS